MKKRFPGLMIAVLLVLALSACGGGSTTAKPVIYLYPEQRMMVEAAMDFDGQLTSTYPEYGDGWSVLAAPDGTLTDPATGREYYCLF